MESSAATVIAELTQVHELAKSLGAHLSQSQIEICRTLASEIASSVEKAICAAKLRVAGEEDSALSNGGGQYVQREQKMSKKRKTLMTKQVRLSTEAGAEMPHDGHSWRKYGQKDILGAKYPRAYYRCTHRKSQGCSAMKQVQKLDENPSVLDITYLGNHTCSISHHHSSSNPPDQHSGLILHLDFGNNIKLNAKSSDLENQNPVSSFSFPSTDTDGMGPDYDFFCSSAIMSPTTSGSNCFPLPPYDPELDEIVSAAISATESPVMDIDFMLEFESIDTEIQFENSLFFL